MGNHILQKQNEIYNPDGGRFLGLAGQKVDKYCGDRDKFVGSYHSYANPVGASADLNNDLNYNTNSCGALQTNITLNPGETKEFVYVLGQKTEKEAAEIIARYEDTSVVEKELAELKEFWHSKLGNLQVHTPD